MSSEDKNFKAGTVSECWLIARKVTENYQTKANCSAGRDRLFFLAKRDAADEIALAIRNGESDEQASKAI